MRVKSRYILIRILPSSNNTAIIPNFEDNGTKNQQLPEKLTDALLSKLLQSALQYQFGVWGTAMSRNYVKVRYYNHTTGLAIVRSPRTAVHSIAYSLSNMTKFCGSTCTVSILHISGTLKKCQLNAIEISRHLLRHIIETDMVKNAVNIVIQSDKTNPLHNNENTIQPTSTLPSSIVISNDGEIATSETYIQQINQIELEILHIDDAT